jgi:hypothetical protein
VIETGGQDVLGHRDSPEAVLGECRQASRGASRSARNSLRVNDGKLALIDLPPTLTPVNLHSCCVMSQKNEASPVETLAVTGWDAGFASLMGETSENRYSSLEDCEDIELLLVLTSPHVHLSKISDGARYSYSQPQA